MNWAVRLRLHRSPLVPSSKKIFFFFSFFFPPQTCLNELIQLASALYTIWKACALPLNSHDEAIQPVFGQTLQWSQQYWSEYRMIKGGQAESRWWWASRFRDLVAHRACIDSAAEQWGDRHLLQTDAQSNGMCPHCDQSGQLNCLPPKGPFLQAAGPCTMGPPPQWHTVDFCRGGGGVE